MALFIYLLEKSSSAYTSNVGLKLPLLPTKKRNGPRPKYYLVPQYMQPVTSTNSIGFSSIEKIANRQVLLAFPGKKTNTLE